jgi:hypothetical protein
MILAPAILAPEESLTNPDIRPRSDWAEAIRTPLNTTTSRKTLLTTDKNDEYGFCIGCPPRTQTPAARRDPRASLEKMMHSGTDQACERRLNIATNMCSQVFLIQPNSLF